jgi:hypothetical protein
MHLALGFVVVLGVQIIGEDLILRIDNQDILDETNVDVPVAEINFKKAERIQEIFKTFQSNISEFFWHETTIENLQSYTKFWFDNGDFVEVKCVEIVEKASVYTRDELQQKYQLLTLIYKKEYENSTTGWNKYSRLHNLLKIEISKEMDRWKRKVKFFEEQKSNSLEKAKIGLKICERVMNLIEQVEKEGK